ncbi:ABC transporter substrate-binding protein [Sediminispirochaeta smaragdinae]|uniref:Extracellular solute-binding protein family 1 n=1 Tax=Sediminispirochaeta smaragdinae (strain DSM 11293 / JCM 15392 / SEBR 4228) TaxID=573413 RepID=E1RBX4_SEDSS|nr:ABC transporter substrate-binding protein [Sediminispirochaeta smaragdinae]ADK79854.1 extracellular solute-binding protein family 1 [Sediminispirochaeta smaragdinae DSM 11293]
MPKKVLLLSLIAVLVTVNGFAGGQKETSQGPVTIQIAYPVAVDAPVTEILDGYARDFMASHPGVTIEPVYAGGYTDIKTSIQTAIDGGGQAPALAVMLATDLFDLVNAQYVEPLSDYVDEMKDGKTYLNDFLPVFLDNSYYQGKLWSLPFQRSAVVMYYNADLLEKEGITPPDSWDALASTAEALTLKDGDAVKRWGIEWPSGWPYWVFQPLAIGAGQNIIGESDTEVYFDNPSVIDAVKYYNSLSATYHAMPAGVQSSWGNVVPNFVSGNTAMIVHSSGSLSKILSQADFTVGVCGVPGKEKGTFASVPGGGNIYMVSGLSDAQKKAAFEFAVFMTDPSRAAQFSIQTGYIATRKRAYDQDVMKEYIKEHPQALETRKALDNAGKELSLQNLNQVRTIFHTYIQAAFNGDMTAEAAMAQAQKEADEALKDFR